MWGKSNILVSPPAFGAKNRVEGDSGQFTPTSGKNAFKAISAFASWTLRYPSYVVGYQAY